MNLSQVGLRYGLRLLPGVEVFRGFEIEHRGDHVGGNRLDRVVEGHHGVVVVLARERDLVLRFRQLLLERGYVAVCLQVRVVFHDGEEALQRFRQRVLRLGLRRGPRGGDGGAPCLDHPGKRLLLVGHVILDDLDQVRDEVVPAFQLHLDLVPGVPDLVAEPNEPVVRGDEPDHENHCEDCRNPLHGVALPVPRFPRGRLFSGQSSGCMMVVNLKVDSEKNRVAKPPGGPPFPELLAPAGSVEAYFAAVSAGADAVYLGLQKFSARQRAENFTTEELCRVLPHARERGVRIYLAMNTVLTEADLPEAIALLHQAAPLLPDAVIVQDLGLLRIAREFFPGLSLHVSTQAGCASAAAAAEFARLGAQRVILERHLRLDEVRQIVARARVGIEIFVHGAMCYSYSGKCFFSSFLGGKSGNRGQCVQPCRRLYGHEVAEEAIFSTRDLSLVDLLPELIPMGFAAFKIEGRMRSAEYVAGVVSAYRRALDLIRAGKPAEGVDEGRAILSEVIGREETRGLTGGASAGDVVGGGGTGNVGQPLGAIREVRDGWAFLAGKAAATRGDRLRVQFQSDGSGKGFTALSMRADPRGFYVRVPFPVSPGDLLFRVGGGGRSEITRHAAKEMEAIRPEGVRFRVAVGESVVAVDASYGKVKRSFSFRISGGEVGAARLPPDAEGRLTAAYRGDLPLGEIRIEGRAGAVSWPDVEALFVKAARKFDKDFYLSGKELRLSILPALRVAGNRREKLPAVFFAGCRAGQLEHLPGGEEIVPVVEFTRALARDPSPAGRGPFRNRAYLRLPAPLLEADAAFLRRTVKEALSKGHRRWVISDIGHLSLFAGFDLRRDVTLITDHYLYAFNLGALSVLSRLGAYRMVLPVEAPLSALRAVGKYLHGLGIAVAYASLPLMVSRLVPAGGGLGGEVVSPRAERFVVDVDERGSTVRPEQPFSASGALHEIRAAGIQDFYADVREASPSQIEAIFTALREAREIPGTSTFNLFRGNF